MLFRYKLTIEYDGTPFCGWQRQDGRISVQKCIEEAMLPFLKRMVPIHCAGRTDAGVHALAQVAHFDFDGEINCFKLMECVNFYLRNIPICILSVEPVSSDFHARISAVERFYIYKILNRRRNATLDINRVWIIPAHLNVEAMNRAAQCLVGKHDFSAFRAAGCQQKSPIKAVNTISVSRDPENSQLIMLKISAKSFLYHQVRNIVGSLKFVGCQKWTEQYFRNIFFSKKRSLAGPTAPACGLYLAGVRYC